MGVQADAGIVRLGRELRVGSSFNPEEPGVGGPSVCEWAQVHSRAPYLGKQDRLVAFISELSCEEIHRLHRTLRKQSVSKVAGKPMTSDRILVTGGTGFIGQHLVDQLLAEGAPVRVLTRRSRPLAENWTSVEIAVGDLRNASSLGAGVQGCGLVYHLAGELRDPAQLQATNIEGTQHLLTACQASPVERVVILSSVGVMGLRKPGPASEETACHPRNAYEKSKYAAEQLALAWSARTDIPVTVLRPTIVFGEGTRAYGDSMLSAIKAIQSGHFAIFDEKAIANYVYVGDVVAACRRAAHARATGVFIVSDSCLLTEFVAAVGDALGTPAPVRVVPLSIGYAVAFCMPALERLLPSSYPRLTVARVRALSNRTRYCSVQIGSALNWHPAFGYRLGLQRTVSWYRQSGLLGGES